MSNVTSSYENGILTGVLLYTQIQQPVPNYEGTKKQWKVSVVVDEDTADVWNEVHGKQEAKVVRSDQFEGIYKIAPPFDAKKQYVITVRKDELLANGQPVPEQYRPKVFVANAKGKLVDVTASKLVGNGSLGSVSIDSFENKYGNFARIKNIKVDHLVEYTKEGGGVSGSEFGEVDSSGDEFGVAVEKPEVKTKAAAKPKKAVPVADIEDDEDSPF